MLRVALRGIRAHLVRFTLTILAVTLGVGFVAGTFSLRTMLSATFDEIISVSVAADAYVRGAEPAQGAAPLGSSFGEARNSIPIGLAETAAQAEGVAYAQAEISGPIVLVGSDGTTVGGGGGAPSFGFAFYPDDPGVTLTDGRAPSGDGEVALETSTLKASGLSVGDSTRVVLAGEVRDVEITGQVDLGTAIAGATIVTVDPEVAEQVWAPDGLVGTISVYGEDGVSEQELAESLDSALAAQPDEAHPAEAATGDAMREESRESIDSMLGFVATFLLVFAGISLFVGAFIIANTFAMSVRQRMREFALLRAVGASPGQVFASILVQAAAIGVIGGALGVLGGLGLVSLLKAFFSSIGMELSGDIPLSGAGVVTSLLLGLVVSVAAAAIPARRAALVPPIEAMRDDVASQEQSLRIRAGIGSLLILGGVAATVGAVVRANGVEDRLAPGAGPLLGLGATLAVIGMLVIAPVIATRVVRVLAAGFVALLRPMGRLARGNVTRNPRRTANTAGALMIGMALVGAATVLAASAQESTREVVETDLTADLIVTSATGFVPSGLIGELRELPEVEAVDIVFSGIVTATSPDGQPLTGGAGTEGTTWIAGLSPQLLDRSLHLETKDGDLGSLEDGQVALRYSTAIDNGWDVGDTVVLAGGAGQVETTIGALFTSLALNDSVLVDESVFTEVVPQAGETAQFVAVQKSAGTDSAALDDAVTAAAAPYVVISVQDMEEFSSTLADQVNQVLNILYALLGLSIVIAILGVVNTLALSVIERTREIGLLRAVGLGRLQLATTITVESILTAVFGTVVGLSVGAALAAAMTSVFSEVGLTSLVIPWSGLAGLLVLAVVFGVVAALWPAIRAARLPVLDAVTYD